MNIVLALKAFFNALNGQTPAGDNIADVIRNGTGNVQRNNESALAGRVSALESLDPIEYEAGEKSFVLSSSTEDSTKLFRITVTDDGTLTATEVV